MKAYPVDEIISELIQTVLRGRSLVLQAPPGAGKTTRVPLALLDIIPPEKGRIIMLEPRRIAAVSAQGGWRRHSVNRQVKRSATQSGLTARFLIKPESRL